MTICAQDMRIGLYRHYVNRAAILFEISANPREEPGEHPTRPGQQNIRQRIIDALTVSRARKKGIGLLDLMAIEIKVSRSDFLADVRDPRKQAAWREIAHRHAFAVPDGLVRPEEIPEESGLLVARSFADGSLYFDWARRAPYTQTPEIPAWLTLSLAWRMSAAEAKVRGITSNGRDGETIEDLRGTVEKLRADCDKTGRRLDRALDEARQWRVAFAAAGHLPCAHCGQPVKPRRVRNGMFSDWRHVDTGHDGACEAIRARKSRWAQVEPADEPEVPELAS